MKKFILLTILSLFILAGCSPTVSPLPATSTATLRPGTLPHYPSATPQPTGTPTPPGSPTPLPSSTPTPRSHTIKSGEDMFGISLRYGISLDELMTANPSVNPRAMSVGNTLVIPASAATPKNVTPQPTPIPLQIDTPVCYPAGDGGWWCFTTAHNPLEGAVESVSVEIRAANADGSQIISQPALALLNLLPAGGSVPLAVYFTAPGFEIAGASAELNGSLPVSIESGRILPVQINDLQKEISSDQKNAHISGTVQLSGEALSASRVWVCAVLRNSNGAIIGLRRWETTESLASGQSVDFSFDVYAHTSKIAQIDIQAEAQP